MGIETLAMTLPRALTLALLTAPAQAGTTQSTASASINLSEKNTDSSLTTNMYFCVVSLGTPTPSSTTDLIFTYTMLQD